MPRVILPSKQSDNSPNWVDLRHPDDFMAADLFAIHRAVRMKQSPGGELDFSNLEMADDRVNSFLVAAITGWSFPTPIPSQNNVAAGDVIIGRTMRAKDWAALRKAAQPLIDELEGEGGTDTKSASGADGAGDPVPGEPAG